MATLKDYLDRGVSLVGRKFVCFERTNAVYEVIRERRVVHELERPNPENPNSEPWEITKALTIQYLNIGGLKVRGILVASVYNDREATEEETETARRTSFFKAFKK